MFTVDQNITDLKLKERNLFKVLFSMNTHPVATPEGSVDDARSYIFFCREVGGKVIAYIGLHFTRTGRRLFYTYSANPFPESAMADVEAEARAFAEDMGAMLDEIDIAKMSPEQKGRWLNELDIFAEKKEEPEATAEQPLGEEPVALDASPEQPSMSAPQPAAAAQPAHSVAPPVQPAPPPSPAPPAQTQSVQAPVAQAPGTEAQRPKRRPAAPTLEVPLKERTPPRGVPMDDVLDQAVKAGVVKVPKKQLSNDLRTATGKVSRDKEALARLLASF